MATPSINQRITLTGAEEVRRHLEEIGKAGERSGNQTRQALLAASSGANTFTAGARAAGTSSGQLRFALQNLSFQVNDVATSLASGGDAMRVFAQQGGQIFQVFQQGGGARAVLGGAASAIRSMITPMTLAAGAAVALGAALATVISRATSSESSARQFDAQLAGLGKTGSISGKELEEAAQRLRDVGLNAEDARKALSATLSGGLADPKLAERIVRTGKELEIVFGAGAMDEFRAAVSKGGEPLRQFAARLGIVSRSAEEAVNSVRGVGDGISKSSKDIAAAIAQRNQSIDDEERQAADQIAELTRKKGTVQEELERASSKRIEGINRQSNRAIVALLSQRNAENAKELAAYNKQIEVAAQKALDTGHGLFLQIENRVKGLTDKALSPSARAMRDFGIAWNNLINVLASSAIITTIANGLAGMFTAISKLVAGEFSIQALGVALLAAIPAFIAFRAAVLGVVASLGPIGLLFALAGVAAAFINWNEAWNGAKAAADGFWTLLKALGGWLGETFVQVVNDFIIGPISRVIAWLQQLIDKARQAARAISSIFGGSGDVPVASAPIPPAGFAAGGLVRGPGSATSDSVPIRASAGEYVVNALSTSRYLPLLEAINALRQPIMPRMRMPRGFAAGGMVVANAGRGAAATIVLDFGEGKVARLDSDAATAQRVVRYARRRSILSTGRKPSTA